ncbi:MAG: hypothetical protein ACRDHM_06910 [Actinomycetota bacterium]
MTDPKIDPELAEELSAARATRPADHPIEVIVEVAGEAEAPLGDDRAAALAEMERTLGALQGRLVARLEQLGAQVQRSALANVLFTALTPDQITEVAAHPDVKAIRANREQQVTT